MLQNTRFVFFGTPEFAAIVLEKLINAGFVPEAVVCNPDRPVGRKKVVTPPPVKSSVKCQVSSVKDKIKILQPENLKSIFLNLKSLNPDFAIVAAYAKILPKEIIDIPRLGVIGVHPSLLPKYRGASPIQSAILNGEKETGVTLYLIDEKMDHGEIVSSIKYQVSGDDTYKKLEKELAILAGDLLVETLPKFIAGEINPEPQDDSSATFTKKFSTDDAFVDEKIMNEVIEGKSPEKALEIYRKILAFTPEPGVWSFRQIEGKKLRIKLLEAELRNDCLTLKKTQIEGQKPVNI